MKKLMIAAAAMMAGVAMADVESANVVGYQTVQIKQGFNMIGLNFTATDGEQIAIQDLFDQSKLTAGTAVGNGDQIQVWDDENKAFTTYFYKQKITTGSPAMKLTDGPGWVENTTGKLNVKTPATIPAGKGFWFKRVGEDVSLNMAGAVKTAKDYDAPVYVGFNMIAMAYPNGVALNGENSPFIVNATAGTAVGNGDQIQVWDDANKSFTTYFYKQKITTGSPAMKLTDGPGWVENTTGKLNVKTPASISVGKGFWYKRVGDDTVIPQDSPLK